jgi:hypothetical protein
MLAATLVKATDVGAPWVVRAKVNQVENKDGELCPGRLEDFYRVRFRAKVTVKMTAGTKAGAAIASFWNVTYTPEQLDAWDAAFDAAAVACKAYKATDGTYVTTEVVTPTFTIEGADVVNARIERVYADAAHKTLYYVRQVIKARVGRAVGSIEHAFVQPRTDPTGKDFTTTAKLMRVQVDKLAVRFAA